jgi:hypothetical protein
MPFIDPQRGGRNQVVRSAAFELQTECLLLAGSTESPVVMASAGAQNQPVMGESVGSRGGLEKQNRKIKATAFFVT